MPSVNSSSSPKVCPSSTLTTPSLPTFSIASAITSPISRSREEIVATRAMSALPSTSFDCFLRFSTTASTACSMPRLSAIGFAPAATFLRPSRTIACARTVAVVVPSPATSTVLAQAIVREGLKNVAAGANPMALKRGIEKAVDAVVENLKSQSKSVSGKEDIARVATVSSREREIGDVIADSIEKVGKDGVVNVEEGQTLGLELEFTEGMQFDKGYLSPYMVTDAERMEAVLDEPYVLVANQKIGAVKDILPVLEQVIQAGKPLLIVAEDVEGESLATIVVNKLRGTFQAVAVKAPGFGDRRKRMLEDIAILSGAEVITEELGLKLENTKLSQLGKARKIVIDKDTTTIIDGAGESDAIKSRIKQLKQEIENTDSDFDREKLQERLAKLSGGVAVVKVGAATETEMKEKKHRVEDALQATRAALEEGIVPGGGVALLRAAADISLEGLEDDEAT